MRAILRLLPAILAFLLIAPSAALADVVHETPDGATAQRLDDVREDKEPAIEPRVLRTAVVIVSDDDSTPPPAGAGWTPETVERAYAGAGGVDEWIRTTSHGRTALDVSVHEVTFDTTSQTPCATRDGGSVRAEGLNALLPTIALELKEQTAVDLTNFHRVVYLVRDYDGPCEFTSAYAFYSGSRSTPFWDGVSVHVGERTPAGAYESLEQLVQSSAHELGHNDGLAHAHSRHSCEQGGMWLSRTADCLLEEYGSFLSIMGTGSTWDAHDPRMQGLHVVEQRQVGWLTGSIAQSSGDERRTISLRAAAPGASGVQALEWTIPDGSGDTIWMEYRRPFWGAAAPVPGLTDGVLLGRSATKARWAWNGTAWSELAQPHHELLDATPGSRSGARDLLDAALKPNRTFHDPVSGFTARVLSISDAEASVEYWRANPDTPAPSAPDAPLIAHEDGSVLLSWPAVTTGAGALKYAVAWRFDGGSWSSRWTYDPALSTKAPADVERVEAAVYVVDGAGRSSGYSPIASAFVREARPALDLRSTPLSTSSARLTWTADPAGAAVSSWEVRSWDPTADASTVLASTTSPEHALTGLPRDGNLVYVVARTRDGRVAPSTTIRAYPAIEPLVAPGDVRTVGGTASSISIAWTAGTGDRRGDRFDVLRYDFATSAWKVAGSTTTTSYTLRSTTDYEAIAVRAVSVDGRSAVSSWAWASRPVVMYELFGSARVHHVVGADVRDRWLDAGWTGGHVVAGVFRYGSPGLVPLRRLVRADGRDTVLSTSTSERTALLAAGWKDAGHVAFVLPKAGVGTLPVRRFDASGVDGRILTSNADYATRVVGAGYRDEGVAFHAAGHR